MSEPDPGETVQLCDVADVEDGDPHVCDVDGTAIAVFFVGGEYFAVDNTCPHQGGPLGEGKIEDDCVYCPWHGWQFDLDSGDHVHGQESVRTYDVTVEDGTVYLTV